MSDKLKMSKGFQLFYTGHKSLVAEYNHFPFIDYGYRKVHNIYDTALSLFSLHNETMNIWSHLLGFFCVLFAGINISADLFSQSEWTAAELFALESYLFCAALCLLLSAIFHWFGCISESCHKCLLQLDLTGIGLLVTGSFLPGVYYGFYCRPDLQQTYLMLTLFILAVGLAAPWVDIKIGQHNIRSFIFATLVIFGAVPFAHWLSITPEIFKEHLIDKFLLMFFWYGLGFTIFITRMPEAFFPKSFITTYLVTSHILWHVCVLNAVYVWLHFLLRYRALLLEQSCSAYGDQLLM